MARDATYIVLGLEEGKGKLFYVGKDYWIADYVQKNMKVKYPAMRMDAFALHERFIGEYKFFTADLEEHSMRRHMLWGILD